VIGAGPDGSAVRDSESRRQFSHPAFACQYHVADNSQRNAGFRRFFDSTRKSLARLARVGIDLG
jgi:hypothetical protein